jgi:hypothetical protein
LVLTAGPWQRRLLVAEIADRFLLEHLELPAMKYAVSIAIAMPREKVAQLLADPAHLAKWL